MVRRVFVRNRSSISTLEFAARLDHTQMAWLTVLQMMILNAKCSCEWQPESLIFFYDNCRFWPQCLEINWKELNFAIYIEIYL